MGPNDPRAGFRPAFGSAMTMGFEPTTSASTGRHSDQLSYVTKVGKVGIEPTISWSQTRRPATGLLSGSGDGNRTRLRRPMRPPCSLELPAARRQGFEPRSLASEASVLPLDDPRMEGHLGFEPSPSAWKAEMLRPLTPVPHEPPPKRRLSNRFAIGYVKEPHPVEESNPSQRVWKPLSSH